MKNFHNVVYLLQLSEEQAEQLALTMVGEIKRVEQKFIKCAQETSLKDVNLMAPEVPSLVEGGDIDMREIESIHRTFAECLAEDNLSALNLIEEIGNVIE